MGFLGDIAGALIGADASKDAAREQSKSSQAVVNENKRQFDLIWGAGAGQRNVGNQAINALGSIYGYSPAGQPGGGQGTQPLTFEQWSAQNPQPRGDSVPGKLMAPAIAQARYRQYVEGFRPQQGAAPVNALTGPDYSNFYKSPDYGFRREEGQRDIGNSFAAAGGAASGNALKALAEFNSGLASGEFGNYFNRQAALAGIGQAATGQGAQAGAYATGNIGNALLRGGDARASGIQGSGEAWGNALQGLGQWAGDWWQGRKKDSQPVANPFAGW